MRSLCRIPRRGIDYVLRPFYITASRLLSSGLLVALLAGPAGAQTKLAFEKDIAPLLKERCWKCHAGAEPKNGLRLTSRKEMLVGGKSGAAIRINAAESSLEGAFRNT